MSEQTMPRGYSIPIVDIANDKSRQFVTDFEKGQYLGHPTTVLFPDDQTMLTVYPKGHGAGQICLKKSTDGGKTWSERLPVPESWSTSLEVPTLYRMVDKEGKARLVLFSGGILCRYSVSEDDGLTWTELTPLKGPNGDYSGIVFIASVINTAPGEYFGLFHVSPGMLDHTKGDLVRAEVLRTGTGAMARTKCQSYRSTDDGKNWSGPSRVLHQDNIQLPDDDYKPVWEYYYRDNKDRPFGVPNDNLTVAIIRTTDGGLTWSEPEYVCNLDDADLCEPGALKSPDGKQIAVLLRENKRRHNSYVIFSDDNGKTWTEPAELPGALTGDRHTARYTPDGRLFVSFRDTTLDSPTRGDWVGWVGTYEDIVNRTEGQYRVHIMKNYVGFDTTYPGVEVQKDGTVITTTYGHFFEGEKSCVMTVRFKLSELDELLAKGQTYGNTELTVTESDLERFTKGEISAHEKKGQ